MNDRYHLDRIDVVVDSVLTAAVDTKNFVPVVIDDECYFPSDCTLVLPVRVPEWVVVVHDDWQGLPPNPHQ